MKKIQMVDLKGQYAKIKDDVDSSLAEVLDSTAFINGPKVQQFQKNLEEYLDVKHVIPCANGTDALQIALMGLGLQQGDEVITSDFTFAATAEVIALLKLTPVLVDVDEDSFNINIEAIKNAITPRTKAIIPVHLFGLAANMEEIMNLANKHNIFVVEDNAQAIGSNYKFSDGKVAKTGTIGHVGTTSFFPSKNLGCYGDGGAIFTNDDKLAHTLRGIVNHGMYERYHHDVVGVNSRLDSMQAAILDIKLGNLNDYNDARREAARKYTSALKDHEKVIVPSGKDSCQGICDTCDCHVFHQYTLRIINSNRDKLVKHLNENDIPCGVYYPIPLHSQKAYKDSRYVETDFVVTNQLVKEVVSLPMHTELEDDQIDYITKTITDYLNSN
ncbi:dTDP-4-amino-4,6-dideoxygalactose transaminase [Flavobacteriaceae bacterium MAR_2010_188]|nr:dTDP-4-amino-4,6-dideoxygalactose transaminase [Flavobacteriaceae bacterium MAR_2010_188]